MAAVSNYSPTGNATTDGILSGTAWTGTSLTYSFPSSSSLYEYGGERDSNFNAFTAIQQDAVRKVLANFSVRLEPDVYGSNRDVHRARHAPLC